MDKSASDPKTHISFICSECKHPFKAEPSRVVDNPERESHPWDYFAECPECGVEASQAWWEKNLLSAWPNATGPKTTEGKEISANNLAGHPTPEEAQRTRFNAMKHGINARVAQFFPPRPGKYARCDGCEYEENKGCEPFQACLKQTELFMKHRAAFATRDPSLLTELNADTQATIRALIDDMVLNIAIDGGTELRSPEYYYDKDGTTHWVEYTDPKTGEVSQLIKTEAHPLLKPLMDFISKNNMTLADMDMTPKVQEEQAALQGFLDNEKEQRETSNDFRGRLQQQQNVLLELIKGQQGRDRDLVDMGNAEVVTDG